MIPSSLKAINGLKPRIRSLFYTTLIFRAGTMAFPFLSAFLLQGEALTTTQIATIVSLYGIGALVADIFAGQLLSIFSTRTIIVTALIFNASALCILPFTSGYIPIAIATLFWGFFYESFTPASYSEITHHTDRDDRKISFSCQRLGINIGMGIGPAIGGVVFVMNGSLLFAINAAICLLAAAYYFIRTSETSNSTNEWVDDPSNNLLTTASTMEAEEPTMGESETAHSANRGAKNWLYGSKQSEVRFWFFFMLSLPIHLSFALPPTFLSAYIIEYVGLPSYWVSLIFMVNAILIVLVEVPLNQKMNHVSHSHALLWGYLLSGVGFLIFGHTTLGVVFLLATVLWTFGEMIVFPSLTYYVSEVSEENTLARNMGLYSAGVNIGLIAAPPLAFMLATQSGLNIWDYFAGSILLSIVAILLIRNNRYVWLEQN